MSKLRLGLGPLQLSPARPRGGGAPAFNPAADPLASCFIDGFCQASLFDDGAGSYSGVLNDAPGPATGSWRIQSLTDRVGGFVFTAPSVAERVTWNHTTKRFESNGTRRLARTGAGTPQDIFPNAAYTIFFDAIHAGTLGPGGYRFVWAFGANTGSTRNDFFRNGSGAANGSFTPRSLSGGGQTNRITAAGFTGGVRQLTECYVAGLNSRLLIGDTVVASAANNDSPFSINGSGIGIFGPNFSDSGNYSSGSFAGFWIFKGGVTIDFEAAFRAWVSGTFI